MSFPGRRVVRRDPTGTRRRRATQQIDYGRCGYGSVFGTFAPATGAMLTHPYPGRTTANRVDGWLDPAATRVHAVLDTLSAHRALDVLL